MYYDMKNLFFIVCTLFLPISLWAQKATEKDLQGNWKLITYEVNGASLDVESGKVTLTQTDNALMAAMSNKLTSDMERYAEGLKTSTLEITGNTFYQVVIDNVRNGEFTLSEKNGTQVMNAKFDNGKNDEIPFKIIDGKLYLFNFQNPKKYIYKKV